MPVHRSLWVKFQCEAKVIGREDVEQCTDLLAALWLEHLDPAGSCGHITQTTSLWSSCNMWVLFALQIYVQAMTSGTCECDTFRELRLWDVLELHCKVRIFKKGQGFITLMEKPAHYQGDGLCDSCFFSLSFSITEREWIFCCDPFRVCCLLGWHGRNRHRLIESSGKGDNYA